MSLKASLLKQVQNQSSIFSTIPRFLEEDATEMNEKTMDLLVLNSIFPVMIVKLCKFKVL